MSKVMKSVFGLKLFIKIMDKYAEYAISYKKTIFDACFLFLFL